MHSPDLISMVFYFACQLFSIFLTIGRNSIFPLVCHHRLFVKRVLGGISVGGGEGSFGANCWIRWEIVVAPGGDKSHGSPLVPPLTPLVPPLVPPVTPWSFPGPPWSLLSSSHDPAATTQDPRLQGLSETLC